MDSDRIAGAAKQFRGSVKQAFGKIVGDRKVQAKGTAEKAAGKAQNVAGSVRDAVRDNLEK